MAFLEDDARLDSGAIRKKGGRMDRPGSGFAVAGESGADPIGDLHCSAAKQHGRNVFSVIIYILSERPPDSQPGPDVGLVSGCGFRMVSGPRLQAEYGHPAVFYHSL